MRGSKSAIYANCTRALRQSAASVRFCATCILCIVHKNGAAILCALTVVQTAALWYNSITHYRQEVKLLEKRFKLELMNGAQVRGRRASADDLNSLVVYARGYLSAAYDFAFWKLGARIVDTTTGKEVYRFESGSVVQ